MKKIYIDSDFRCHVTDDGTMTAVETSFFDGKCDTFIEGYRLKPAGENRTRSEIAPWKDYDLLAAAQAQYEADLAEAAAAYKEGVNSAYDQ